MATKPITLIFIFYQRYDGQAGATLLRSVLLSGDQPFDGSFSEDGARRCPATSTWVSELRNLVRQHISPLARDVGGTCRQLGFSSIFLFVSHQPLAWRPQINLTRILFQQLKTNFRSRDSKGKLFSTNQASNVVGQVEQAVKKLNQSFSSSRKIINNNEHTKDFGAKIGADLNV